MKTKPFNIDKARAGHPVCTRDLRPVRILCYDMSDGISKDNILALVSETDGSETAYAYNRDGTFMGAGEQHRLDLQLAGTKKSGWINLYRDRITDFLLAYSAVYDTEEDASRHVTCKDDEDYVASVKIEWEE